jgi:hypothetical protein
VARGVRHQERGRGLTEALSAVDRGTYIEPSKQTLERYLLDEWLPACAARLLSQVCGIIEGMSKRGRRQNLEKARQRAAPQVHVRVACADTDLRAAAALVKPAILYADRVTVYSPAAWMLTSVAEFAAMTDPRKQAATMLEIIRDAPSLAPEILLDEAKVRQFIDFLQVDPRRLVGRREVYELETHFAQLSTTFRDQMPEILRVVAKSTGAEELLTAVDADAVAVANITPASPSTVIANCVKAATGDDQTAASTDDLIEGYTAKIIEILVGTDSFPLLDGRSSDLARGLEAAAAFNSSDLVIKRRVEVSAAAQFMGFLPYFPDLPMDEVLDLRRELRAPLVRFRAAMVGLSSEFRLRSLDDGFAAEVADSWRSTVAPALADIREALAEHGLLREVASVALGDPRRLAFEAGGVLAAGAADIGSLSRLLMTGVAASIPVVDVVGRALQNVRESRAEIRRNGFYFLHRLGAEAERRTA